MARQEAFSARLIEAMSRAGMKQADVIHAASKYGGRLGKSQVSQYVSGKTVPRRNVMALLAQVLGVREVWLADGMGPMVDESHSANDANSVTRGAWQESALGPAKMDDVNEAPAPADDVTRASARPAAASNSFTPNPKRSASMREFKKSTKLDNVLYDVRGPVADEAARMESEGLRILKLNIGNPAPFGFRTPD